MRVAVVGSKQRDSEIEESLIAISLRVLSAIDPELVVVTGGDRKGADRIAKQWAERMQILYVEYRPELRKGMNRGEVVQAYYARNRRMVQDAQLVIALCGQEQEGFNRECSSTCQGVRCTRSDTVRRKDGE